MSIWNKSNVIDDFAEDELDEKTEAVEPDFEEPDGDDGEEEEGGKTRTFTVRGKVYEVCFSKKRIDLYEQRHKPIMASFIQNDGAFSAAELTALLAYGLRVEGGGYVNPKRGMDMAEKLVLNSGYLAVYEAVTEALERDCGFLFLSA